MTHNMQEYNGIFCYYGRDTCSNKIIICLIKGGFYGNHEMMYGTLYMTSPPYKPLVVFYRNSGQICMLSNVTYYYIADFIMDRLSGPGSTYAPSDSEVRYAARSR